MRTAPLLSALLLHAAGVLAAPPPPPPPPPGPPRPADAGITGTSFLNHTAPLLLAPGGPYYGQSFLEQNIPFIDIPDQNIQNIYYYRWYTLATHLRYTIAGSGYILTEFVQPVGYAQAFDTIDAAAGHQIDETRWLRGTYFDDDYIQIWTRGPGNSVQYTNWINDAAYRRSLVDGNVQFINAQLDGMMRMYSEWDYVFDAHPGLYYFTPDFDAQEYSYPGYYYGAEYNDPSIVYVGPNTYRPSLNAYMVANARAIAAVASQTGNHAVATNYTNVANALEAAMYKYLWNPSVQFFVDVIRLNNPNLTQLPGREEVGLFPYRFGIGLTANYLNAPMEELFDPQGFLAEYPPTTLEIRNQYFDATKPDGYCCYWNGQNWPYSTAHVLKSIAAAVRSGVSNVTADEYYQYLSYYATTQHKNGLPYVAEAHYPFMDAWSADSTNHSEGYDHSTNNDDVITGLLGVVPRADNKLQISPLVPSNWTYFALENLPYHGYLLTILYDADGTRYGQGSGLTVFVNGKKSHNSAGMSATFPLPGPNNELTTAFPDSVPVNIAANPLGLGYFPAANATYTYPTDAPFKANDGFLFWYAVPDNRWTNYASPNANDTLQITFPRPRNITSVTLAVYSDRYRAQSGGVDCASEIQLYGSTGLLATVPNFNNVCPRNDFYTIYLNTTVLTSFVAINSFNDAPYFVGYAEIQVWVPPNAGPVYYAVDALLNGAQVGNSAASTATSNGAVVTGFGAPGTISFSGVYSPDGGPATLTLSYANSGAATAFTYAVNQVTVATVALAASSGKFQTVAARVTLEQGNNFVTVAQSGGGAAVMVDTLTVVHG